MAGKRKVHLKTDISIPIAERLQSSIGRTADSECSTPPTETLVHFGYNAEVNRSFDFAKYYGVNIDEITSAFQIQIQRFIAKQDSELEITTVVSYATQGSKRFLDYLTLLASVTQRALKLSDIDRDVIDGYIRHLSASNIKLSVQSTAYNGTRQVLLSIARRGLFQLIETGDSRTFPKNPFPNSNRHVKGETPLSRKQRLAFSAAVKTAVMPLLHDDVEVTSDLLTYALLIIALHTGRNTTPLLEMTPDCLRSHPREDLQFLVLWKRRGHNTSKATLRAEYSGELAIESMPSVNVPVIRLVKRVVQLSNALRAEAPAHLAQRVWLYRSRERASFGTVTALTESTILKATRRLISSCGLSETNGKPLRINVSRLRKTFANRVFELLDGDLGSTAVALGNTPLIAGRNYMMPSPESQKNWKFLGEFMTEELMTGTLGASERTPLGRCTDTTNGQYAPKKDALTCFSFLDCLRCRNYAVSGDDLYRVFSFYWRVLRERDRLDARLWSKHYAHIPRMIERDVVEAGLKRGVFNEADVVAAKDRARTDPHPFWRYESLDRLETFRTTHEVAA